MRVHFTGIKGVGMAALALAYQDRGWEVQGSDTKEWFITDDILKRRAIKVYDRFTPRILDTNIDLLVHTAAHKGINNVEVKWAQSRGIKTMNYARALGEFFADKNQICVCGVGGKTTTTAMIATILYNASLRTEVDGPLTQDPSWIIGTSEVDSLPAAGRYGNGEWAVIEGDEYAADMQADKTPKFMYLNPKIVVCTNISYDHPDMYKSEEDVRDVYQRLFDRTIKNGGKVIRLDGIGEIGEIGEIRERIRRVLKVPGEYNLKNALLAVAAAKEVGISEGTAIAALGKYTGAKRRFEKIGEVGGISLYDDYAHHPTEIRALLAAAKEKFPEQRIRFIFQPHTYSRTKALFKEFAQSLAATDETIMYPIFASARERIDPSISSQLLAREINRLGGRAIYVPTIEKLVQYLCQSAKSPEVIFTVGAGNLYELHHQLVKGLRER